MSKDFNEMSVREFAKLNNVSRSTVYSYAIIYGFYNPDKTFRVSNEFAQKFNEEIRKKHCALTDDLIPIEKICKRYAMCQTKFYTIIRGKLETVLALNENEKWCKRAYLRQSDIPKFEAIVEDYYQKIKTNRELKSKELKQKRESKPISKEALKQKLDEFESKIPFIVEKILPEITEPKKPKTIDIGLKPELKEAYLRNDSYWS